MVTAMAQRRLMVGGRGGVDAETDEEEQDCEEWEEFRISRIPESVGRGDSRRATSPSSAAARMRLSFSFFCFKLSSG